MVSPIGPRSIFISSGKLNGEERSDALIFDVITKSITKLTFPGDFWYSALTKPVCFSQGSVVAIIRTQQDIIRLVRFTVKDKYATATVLYALGNLNPPEAQQQ